MQEIELSVTLDTQEFDISTFSRVYRASLCHYSAFSVIQMHYFLADIGCFV